VGDAVLFTPALTCLRKHYPMAKISAMVTPWVQPLLAINPDVDDIIVYDPKGKHRRFGARLSFANGIRKKGFEVAILFPNSFHSALLVYLARIPERIGYNTDSRGLLLTKSIPLNKDIKTRHQVEYYMDIVRGIGMDCPAADLALRLGKTDDKLAEQFLRTKGIDLKQPLIAVHPGAVKPEKRWPAERFAKVARIMADRYGALIILLGSQNELDLLKEIAWFIGTEQSLILGGAELLLVAALIKRCKIFIGNDSGLMHIAAALGVNLVAVFGPGTPATTAPWMDKSRYRIVINEMSCRPCRQRFFTECKASPQGRPPCLESITVEQVTTAVADLWDSPLCEEQQNNV
jgi:heptosyltransferase-2